MKSARILFSILLTVFLLVGCVTSDLDMTPTAAAGEIVTLTDGLDRQVSLQVPALRIVSLTLLALLIAIPVAIKSASPGWTVSTWSMQARRSSPAEPGVA